MRSVYEPCFADVSIERILRFEYTPADVTYERFLGVVGSSCC